MELEKEILLKDKFKNGIRLDFVRYRSQNLTQPIFNLFFNKISFSTPNSRLKRRYERTAKGDRTLAECT